MSDSIFLPDDFTETVEIEAKLAQGRNGRGELPQSFWETYSAFANTQGGTVFLGVKETGDQVFEAVGLLDVERVETDLWNQLNNRQKVSHNLLQARHVTRHPLENGKTVLIIWVPRAERSERPVFVGGDVFGGSYKRNRSGDYKCAKEEVERMLAERVEESRDTRILPKFNFDDLANETVVTYRQRLAVLKPDHPYNGLSPREFLKAIGAWGKNRESGDEGLTVAGILMFGNGNSLREVFPHYFLDYRELPVSGSKTEWVDRLTPDGTWSGNLYDFYRQVITRLFRDLKVPLNISNDQRQDDTPFHKALREALVNTLVHADYTERISTLVVKAPDYYGFRNPGQMRISIEDALSGGKSDCRNRTLQKMFSLIGLGEQAGSGIPRIVKNWSELSYRQPELWEDAQPPATLMRLRTVSLLPPEVVEILSTRFKSRYTQLSEIEKMALVTAYVEGFVSNQRIQQVCRDHPHDITKMLQGLVAKDLLEPDGTGRARTYRLAGTSIPDRREIELDIFGGADVTSLTGSSSHLANSSTHLANSSTHLEQVPLHLDAGNKEWMELQNKVADIRSAGKAPKEKVEQAILSICKENFLTAEQIGLLLGRDPNGLRGRFLTPMQKQGLLSHRFPASPNHKDQAYRTAL